MIFIAKGQPQPKPRATKRDKWLNPPRPPIERYRIYKSQIIEAWARCGQIKILGKVRISCQFFVHGKLKCDLDNLIKSVLDSLSKYAFLDDNIDIIPEYGTMKATRVRNPEEARTIIELTEVL